MDRSKFSEILNKTIIPGDVSDAQLNQAMCPIRQALLELKPNKSYRYRSVTPNNIDALKSDSVYTVTADRFNDHTGRSSASTGCDTTKNRLYYDSDKYTFRDTEAGASNTKKFDVSQVRPNDGKQLIETIAQPARNSN